MQATIYIRPEDEEAWNNIPNKSKWIHEGLNAGFVPAKSIQKKNKPLPDGKILDEVGVWGKGVNTLIDETQIPKNENIHVASTPAGPNEFAVAVEAGMPKCCKARSPCKHWSFDGEVWRDTLTGEEREPTT